MRRKLVHHELLERGVAVKCQHFDAWNLNLSGYALGAIRCIVTQLV